MGCCADNSCCLFVLVHAECEIFVGFVPLDASDQTFIFVGIGFGVLCCLLIYLVFFALFIRRNRQQRTQLHVSNLRSIFRIAVENFGLSTKRVLQAKEAPYNMVHAGHIFRLWWLLIYSFVNCKGVAPNVGAYPVGAMYSNVPAGSASFPCAQCGKIYPTQNDLQIHVGMRHSSANKYDQASTPLNNYNNPSRGNYDQTSTPLDYAKSGMFVFVIESTPQTEFSIV
jgi:hypothetical protein